MKRVSVVGNIGAGKSTLALAQAIGAPFVKLDALRHRGPTNLDAADLVRRVGNIARAEHWVIDGNYERVLVRSCGPVATRWCGWTGPAGGTAERGVAQHAPAGRSPGPLGRDRRALARRALFRPFSVDPRPVLGPARQLLVARRAGHGLGRLVGHVPPGSDPGSVDPLAVLEEMADRVDSRKVPGRCVVVPEMPLTVNRKVDRRAARALADLPAVGAPT